MASPGTFQFSSDPRIAEKQMQTLIFALTAFGHIDGDFDERERDFVRSFIRQQVRGRIDSGLSGIDDATKEGLEERFSQHFLETFEAIDEYVLSVTTEPVAYEEDRDQVVQLKLKQKCFELLREFTDSEREVILNAIDACIAADGEVHPAEAKFRSELLMLLGQTVELELRDLDDFGATNFSAPIFLAVHTLQHDLLLPLERNYSRLHIDADMALDLALIDGTIAALHKQRVAYKGALQGKRTVQELEAGVFGLDGHVYFCNPTRSYDLVVLGDLHGCYSCLKAGIMQTRFLAKIDAYRADNTLPYPLLVFLGDYIDRGIFSLNGVLRAVLQLFLHAPEHVICLRGNHEHFFEHEGQIYGGVQPSEAVNSLRGHLPMAMFRKYMELFEELPTSFLFEQVMFVHAGIPRDRTLKDHWRGLESLNDKDVRFQMMWSDPSPTDVIPAIFQDQMARFPFGKLQFQAFMQRIGMRTLIRGHEKVERGFQRMYPEGRTELITLFSSGGVDNADLPEESSYRSVIPSGMLMQYADGTIKITPFELNYRLYQDPARNGFLRTPLEIEHRLE